LTEIYPGRKFPSNILRALKVYWGEGKEVVLKMGECREVLGGGPAPPSKL